MKIGVFVLVLILGLGGAFLIWRDWKKNSPLPAVQPSAVSRREATSTASVRQEPKITWPLPVPDLNRPINITENLSPQMQKEAKEHIAALIIRLKENPQLYSHWIDLGLYRKLIGDFEGTREAWEYAARLQPEEGLPFHNLGDLYNFELKDFSKAEKNYMQAVAADPDQIFFYEKLYEFYRFSKKDEVRARQMLEKGIAQNPAASERLRWLLENF